MNLNDTTKLTKRINTLIVLQSKMNNGIFKNIYIIHQFAFIDGKSSVCSLNWAGYTKVQRLIYLFIYSFSIGKCDGEIVQV
jgi:hypothetical protein